MCIINPYNPFGIPTTPLTTDRASGIGQRPVEWKSEVSALNKTPFERVLGALGEVDANERKRILDAATVYFKDIP